MISPLINNLDFYLLSFWLLFQSCRIKCRYDAMFDYYGWNISFCVAVVLINQNKLMSTMRSRLPSKFDRKTQSVETPTTWLYGKQKDITFYISNGFPKVLFLTSASSTPPCSVFVFCFKCANIHFSMPRKTYKIMS